MSSVLHTERSFRNLIKPNQNQIEFTSFQLIWNQADVCLGPNQLENGKYNLISVLFNKIQKIYLCVKDTETFDANAVDFCAFAFGNDITH